MKQCLNCMFYDEKKDALLQPDYIVEGEDAPEFHICACYESIPKDIVSDEKQCEYRIAKD